MCRHTDAMERLEESVSQSSVDFATLVQPVFINALDISDVMLCSSGTHSIESPSNNSIQRFIWFPLQKSATWPVTIDLGAAGALSTACRQKHSSLQRCRKTITVSRLLQCKYQIKKHAPHPVHEICPAHAVTVPCASRMDRRFRLARIDGAAGSPAPAAAAVAEAPLPLLITAAPPAASCQPLNTHLSHTLCMAC